MKATTDIRQMNAIGKDSAIVLSLSEIANSLPIPEQLKNELTSLSDEFAEVSYYVSTSDVRKKSYAEGRGIYSKRKFDNKDITLYTKGTGSQLLIKENKKFPFPAFGAYNGDYFFDDVNMPLHFPRKYGAEFLSDARIEFFHALRVMVDQINLHSINSLDELIDSGISIPVSVAHYKGLTNYIRDVASGSLKGTAWSWNDDVQLGSVSLLVPSDRRLGTMFGTTSHEGLIPTLKTLLKDSNAVMSRFSAHTQNFYLAKNSLCSQADNSDMFFMDGMTNEDKSVMFVGSMLRILEDEIVRFGLMGCAPYLNASMVLKDMGYIGSTNNKIDALLESAQELLQNQSKYYTPDQIVGNQVLSGINYKQIQDKRRDNILAECNHAITQLHGSPSYNPMPREDWMTKGIRLSDVNYGDLLPKDSFQPDATKKYIKLPPLTISNDAYPSFNNAYRNLDKFLNLKFKL